MQIHGSCAARDGAGVLLLGEPGSGKSDLLLRLLDRGFVLVADDRVDIAAGIARPPSALAGVIEVRGLGLFRIPFLPETRLVLAVRLGRGERLPEPMRHDGLDLPLVAVDPALVSAAQRISLALDAVLGRMPQIAGALA